MPNTAARFELGRLTASPAVLEAIPKEELLQFVGRHLRGDWGDTSESGARENEFSIRHGLRIISWYQASNDTRIMILTEADRSATTVLLPEEY